MNNTISLPQLISKLAQASGCTPAEARRFIHDLFADIEQALSHGRSMVVDGIGEFAPGLDSATPVLFRPDPALASALNEPFEAFSAVELPAEMPDSFLQAAPAQESEATPEPAPESDSKSVPAPVAGPEPEQVPEPAAESEPIPAPEPENESEPEPEQESVAESTPEITQSVAPEPALESAPEPETAPEPEPAPVYMAPATGHSTGLWLVCGIMIGLIIGLVGGYFAGKAVGRYEIPVDEYDDEEIDTLADVAALPSAAIVTDTVAPAPAPEPVQPAAQPEVKPEPVAAVPQPVYDVITREVFLTKLAQKHYGVKTYWVFIYEANPGLGNPNQVRPGTKVLIPDRSTFEEATPEATRRKAQQHLNELSRKYKL